MDPTPEHPFGEALREARTRAGLSVEDLARATRIQVRYLRAMEAEAWAEVPGGVIGRGFVRVVARELRVPADDLMERYRASRREEPAPTPRGLPEPEWEVPLTEERSPLPLGWLLLLAVVGGLVAAGWWAARTGNLPWSTDLPVVSARQPVGREPAPAAEAKAPQAEAAQAKLPQAEAAQSAPRAVPIPKEPPAGPAPAAAETPEQAREPAPAAPERLRLGIRAVEKAWVRVIADGGAPQDRVFQPGEERTFEAEKGFRVKLGNAGGVRFVWNGEPLKAPGLPGQVKEIRLPEDLAALRP